jgi:hypothetical protein
MLTATELASPLARYAERFHTALGDGHHVASPLGAWLLLALAASAARGDERAQLVDVLGIDVDQAAATARALLSELHPLVGAAAAVWHRPEVITDALNAWLRALPDAIETGGMPTQVEADAWAREHTLGLIGEFPLELTEDVKVVLASALATRVSWFAPFELVPAAQLGAGSRWATEITHALRTPRHPLTGGSLHDVFIASTTAGDVGVHTALARHEANNASIGLHVTTVIAAPDVAAADVLGVAYDLATAPMRGGLITRRSLFDLPLGDGAAWTITEEPADPTTNDPPERAFAVLPAWSARSDHDLSAPALGFPAAATALEAVLPAADWQFEARQSVMARYDRTGFEAAAVTALAMLRSKVTSMSRMNRTVEVRFGHPFAVVAVTSDTRWDPATNEVRSGPWHGVPVFSAWVTEPDDANDDENGHGAA